jgi:putative transcriptional regulator
MSYRLLQAFQGLFDGKRYLHRNSTRGDWVAHHLYEDLLELRKKEQHTRRTDRRSQTVHGISSISVRTLQEWEEGRRAPSGAARTLLLIAAKNRRALLDVA